jgi:hypothetical protein
MMALGEWEEEEWALVMACSMARRMHPWFLFWVYDVDAVPCVWGVATAG